MTDQTKPPVGCVEELKRAASARALLLVDHGDETYHICDEDSARPLGDSVTLAEIEAYLGFGEVEAVEGVPARYVTEDSLRAQFDAIERGGFDFARDFARFCYVESITATEGARRVDRPESTVRYHTAPLLKIAKSRKLRLDDLGSITVEEYAEAKSPKPKPVEAPRPTLSIVPPLADDEPEPEPVEVEETPRLDPVRLDGCEDVEVTAPVEVEEVEEVAPRFDTDRAMALGSELLASLKLLRTDDDVREVPEDLLAVLDGLGYVTRCLLAGDLPRLDRLTAAAV